MKSLVLLATLASGGCVTGASIARPHNVSLPLLIGAAAADLVVTSLVVAQLDEFSTGGAIATGAAVMAVDVGVGCILGGCKSLKP
ncbi:MAG: hypothetical protein ACTHU0_36430 [Kofleriaceae bacterium]